MVNPTPDTSRATRGLEYVNQLAADPALPDGWCYRDPADERCAALVDTADRDAD